MKTLKSIYILALICITLLTSSWKYNNKGTTITVKALEEIVTPKLLKESADIISLRLTTYGLDTFCLNINENRGEIAITVPDKSNLEDISGLLTQKGVLALYETYDREETKALLSDGKLLDMFSHTDNQIGCISPADSVKVNLLLHSQRIPDNVIFRWGVINDRLQVSLFALKSKGNPLLMRSDFEEISYSDNGRINFTLKKESSEKWADATARNLDRSVAVLIDDKVISSPVVRQTIESGKFEISGNYSEREARFFTALLCNNQLPLTFLVIR
ncbi:MAG TPA: hypothetical protein PLR88_11660 [Bacteroidales bacterium]|nr:hypothetical protein [Bacteroidales bacterium]HPT22592.1 hypothetical protein [Bacteroidales bacterium]